MCSVLSPSLFLVDIARSIVHSAVGAGGVKDRVELLKLPELWRINSLGQRSRMSIMKTRYNLRLTASRLSLTLRNGYVSMKYKDKKQYSATEFRFHDDEEPETAQKRKMPSRISAYEVAKKSIVSKLANKFGLPPHQVVLNFLASQHVHFVDDVNLNPVAYAEQFADSDLGKAQTAEELLRRARMILSTELGKDPLLGNHMRKIFREDVQITVEPTERGITKIDDSHPYFNFKYLLQKPINDRLDTPQFLHILAAEADHLVTVSIFIPPDSKAALECRLLDAISYDSFSDSAKAWKAERSLIVQEVIQQHLIPAGIKWTREYIREEVEDVLGAHSSNLLRQRVDVEPFLTRELKYGGSACSVLAISWGKGDPHKDAITIVFVDEAGQIREHTKIDNLHDMDNRDEFKDLLVRRKPNVVGGFSVAALKLMHLVKAIFRGSNGQNQEETAWGQPAAAEEVFDIPAIYVNDDVARIYQHSKRASDEFSALSPTASIGLAWLAMSKNMFSEEPLGSSVAGLTLGGNNYRINPCWTIGPVLFVDDRVEGRMREVWDVCAESIIREAGQLIEAAPLCNPHTRSRFVLKNLPLKLRNILWISSSRDGMTAVGAASNEVFETIRLADFSFSSCGQSAAASSSATPAIAVLNFRTFSVASSSVSSASVTSFAHAGDEDSGSTLISDDEDIDQLSPAPSTAKKTSIFKNIPSLSQAVKDILPETVAPSRVSSIYGTRSNTPTSCPTLTLRTQTVARALWALAWEIPLPAGSKLNVPTAARPTPRSGGAA
ncbi:hypothetical protein GALMADRAFT_139807 [Galerina marginata CBS 339.88]|uniref:Uncharacterized protein n=1 Tax=Galerina marginata (strain CBS 339.88) TaxID=685588 RepID=A0A067SYV4_GALM3|nr:hypothetical protein GALMADRAFT_139807 [Galerina marginata CBS 339.88]